MCWVRGYLQIWFFTADDLWESRFPDGQSDHVVEHIFDFNAETAGGTNQSAQLIGIEQVPVLRIVIWLGRHRQDEESAGDAAHLPDHLLWVLHMLQGFQQADAIEGTVVERQERDTGLEMTKGHWPAGGRASPGDVSRLLLHSSLLNRTHAISCALPLGHTDARPHQPQSPGDPERIVLGRLLRSIFRHHPVLSVPSSTKVLWTREGLSLERHD